MPLLSSSRVTVICLPVVYFFVDDILIYRTCTADRDSNLEGLYVAKCNLGKVNLKSKRPLVFPRNNMHAWWLIIIIVQSVFLCLHLIYSTLSVPSSNSVLHLVNCMGITGKLQGLCAPMA